MLCHERQPCKILDVLVEVRDEDRVALLKRGGQPRDRLTVALDQHVEIGEVVSDDSFWAKGLIEGAS